MDLYLVAILPHNTTLVVSYVERSTQRTLAAFWLLPFSLLSAAGLRVRGLWFWTKCSRNMFDTVQTGGHKYEILKGSNRRGKGKTETKKDTCRLFTELTPDSNEATATFIDCLPRLFWFWRKIASLCCRQTMSDEPERKTRLLHAGQVCLYLCYKRVKLHLMVFLCIGALFGLFSGRVHRSL